MGANLRSIVLAQPHSDARHGQPAEWLTACGPHDEFAEASEMCTPSAVEFDGLPRGFDDEKSPNELGSKRENGRIKSMLKVGTGIFSGDAMIMLIRASWKSAPAVAFAWMKLAGARVRYSAKLCCHHVAKMIGNVQSEKPSLGSACTSADAARRMLTSRRVRVVIA